MARTRPVRRRPRTAAPPAPRPSRCPSSGRSAIRRSDDRALGSRATRRIPRATGRGALRTVPTVTEVRRERTVDAPRLDQPGLRFRDDALGQRHDHGERLEREQVRLPEPSRAVLEDPRLVARRGRTDRPCVAGDIGDRGRRADGRGRLLDGHLPVLADRVPVELVVVAEAVHGGLDRVHDRVGVQPGDRLVGIADLDPCDAAGLLRDLVVRRRAAGRLHRLHVQRIDAVVPVVVRLACRARRGRSRGERSTRSRTR